jgi:hypothetical protein
MFPLHKRINSFSFFILIILPSGFNSVYGSDSNSEPVLKLKSDNADSDDDADDYSISDTDSKSNSIFRSDSNTCFRI